MQPDDKDNQLPTGQDQAYNGPPTPPNSPEQPQTSFGAAPGNHQIEPIEPTNPIQPATINTAHTPTQPTPPQLGGVVSGAFDPPPGSVPPPPKSKLPKKQTLLVGLVAVGVLLIGGGAGAYFGLYVPSKPENVWAKSLSNTAAGYDKLVEKFKESENQKGGTLKGTFKVEADQVVFDGNVDSKFYEKNSATKVDVGFMGARFNAEILTNVPQSATNPDIYAKVSGLKGLDQAVGSGVGSALSSYDNQWYFVDHTLLDQYEKSLNELNQSTEATPAMPSLTTDDYKAIAEAVGRVNREYLFTDDSNKAVFNVAENVGKERMDERSVYHYKVGYNKDHLKSYATAMKDELKKTKLKDLMTDDVLNDLVKDIDKLDGKSTADVWVDMRTKTIRKVRFYITDPQSEARAATDQAQNGDSEVIPVQNKEDNYIDIGLKYEGGDELPFVVSGKTKDDLSSSSFDMTVNLNMKTNVVKLEANLNGTTGSSKYNANFDGTMTPSNEQVEFKKPESVKSIMELLGPMQGSTGVLGDAISLPGPGNIL